MHGGLLDGVGYGQGGSGQDDEGGRDYGGQEEWREEWRLGETDVNLCLTLP